MSFARALGEFGATITFVSNIPGETQTLPLALYTLVQSPDGEFGALRLALISILISLLALIASGWLAKRFTRASEGQPMIDINVQKSLGDFQISAKIGLESDGVIALFGRSGSGKTSLVNMIAGLTTPDSGTISIAGKTLFDSSQGINVPPEQRSLGYVF